MGNMSYISDQEIEPSPITKFDPRVELKRKVLRSDFKMYLARIYASACSHGTKIDNLSGLEVPPKSRHQLLAIGFDNDVVWGIFRKNPNDKVKTLRVGVQPSKQTYESLVECERSWEAEGFCNLMPVIAIPDSELTNVCMPVFIQLSDLQEEFGEGFTSTVITELTRLSECDSVDVFQSNLVEEI
jgi:hypothetical protein